MRWDQVAIRESKRKAFDVLSKPILTHHVIHHDMNAKTMTAHKKGKENPFYIEADLVSGPGYLVGEVPFVNTTTSFNFNFSLNGFKHVTASTTVAPLQAGDNNITLPQNNIFAIYGLQLWLGYQQPDNTGNLTSALTQYRSWGITPNDECIYNSVLSMQIESSTLIDLWDGKAFRENGGIVSEYWNEMGLVLITPIRVLTGKLGKFNFNVTVQNPIANIPLSGSNIVLSMRLWGMNGQKSGY